MRLSKTLMLSAAALATIGAGAAPAFADAHRKPHKVCKVEHVHGHAKKVCKIVR